MAMGSGRRREHLIYENKKGGISYGYRDTDVVENTYHMKIKGRG
jgi:hypothetical protein